MSVTPEDCFHLTVEIVREIHAEAIATFGGSDGIRERALLESAVIPEAALLEQGGMRPSLNNLPFMHDHDEVGSLDC